MVGAADHLAAVARTQAHLVAGQAAGWVRWRQLSPTQRSFDDWAVPSLDALGLPVPDSREIPTDNLVARALRSDARVGASSGQTLADDTSRLEAVRDALGADGKIRIDAIEKPRK